MLFFFFCLCFFVLFLGNQQKVKDIYHKYHKGLGKEVNMAADDDSELDDEDI